MPTQKEAPLCRITVVQVGSGQKREAAIADYGESLYWPEHLRKDGRKNEARGRDGWMANEKHPDPMGYVLYDPDREARAASIRIQVEQIRQELAQAERALCEVYISPQAR